MKSFAILIPTLVAISAPAFAQPERLVAGPLELTMLVTPIVRSPESGVNAALDAATYWDQIPVAAHFVNANRGLTGDELATAYAKSNLKLNASVVSLLDSPDLLNLMANNMTWTSRLGTAMLTQREDVMDAVRLVRSGRSRPTPAH